MALDQSTLQVIQRCMKSPSFFIDNFCRIEHPKLGIIPFKLFSYQLNALSEFVSNRFSIFKKCRQCFVEGTPVWTPKGPIPIEKIKPKDLIYSLDADSGLLTTKPVAAVHDNGTSSMCYEVRTKSGHRSVCTHDHEFLTQRGWVEAAKLTKDDILVETFEPERYNNKPSHPSDPILLGYLLTDGGCNKGNFYFANSRWKYLLEFQKHYKLKFGRKIKIKKVKSGFENDSDKNHRITSCYADGQKWLESYNLRHKTGMDKEIPEQIFSWDNESIATLLNRMFAGDGWYSGGNCNEVGIGQQSIKVLYQIKQLLSRFGINCKVYEATKTSIPKLRIYGSSDFAKFVDQIGIFGKIPRKSVTKGFFFNRKKGQIKSVKQVEGSFKVYDLTAPPHHNYIVDGAVVHNCGISTLTGAYALWYAMFQPNKKILIVSKRDDDAIEFLRRNVKLLYENLPEWMRELWPTVTFNQHTVMFSNGSIIRSLSSSPDTLRSSASSLNIIDEAAFIPKMDEMWLGGWSTIQHGGSVIVISTTGGMGNWYWKTWTEAESQENDFKPIKIDWWDMDWALEFEDEISGEKQRICPIDDIRDCNTKEEQLKYGPHWSPWLEGQYRELTSKGDTRGFFQEILADFVGAGDTVLNREALIYAASTVEPPIARPARAECLDPDTYHPLLLNFGEQFHIWKEPVKYVPADPKTGEPSKYGHTYVMGVDTSTGHAEDYSAIVVIDIDTMEQVAELRIKTEPDMLAIMADYIGRMYNNAFIVCERTGIGFMTCNNLNTKLSYPWLYRERKKMADVSPTKQKYGQVGFNTNGASKELINGELQNNIMEGKLVVRSQRLLREFQTYIYITENKTGAQPGVGNNDDLVIACGLALYGIVEARRTGLSMSVPLTSSTLSTAHPVEGGQLENITMYNRDLVVPIVNKTHMDPKETAEQELARFMTQIGGIPTVPTHGGPAIKTPMNEDDEKIQKQVVKDTRQAKVIAKRYNLDSQKRKH